MKNKYGNFVLFKLIAKSKVEEQLTLMQSLVKNLNIVNNTKFKNYWTRFIDDNPLQIPLQGLTIPKTSQFKNNCEPSEIDSPMTADEWKSLRQAAAQIVPGDSATRKNEFTKSNDSFSQQFNHQYGFNYYQGQAYNCASNSGMGDHNGFINGYFEKENLSINQKPRNTNGYYNEGVGNIQKNKNPHQKFYVERNHQRNDKWGYNYFY